MLTLVPSRKSTPVAPPEATSAVDGKALTRDQWCGVFLEAALEADPAGSRRLVWAIALQEHGRAPKSDPLDVVKAWLARRGVQ